MFDPDKLLAIEIEIPEANWDTLRFQSRNIVKLLGENCGQASGSPFTYVKANVTIDGQLVSDVGVRKKGFLGSLSETKPSLKIKFNKFVPGQRFSGWKRMTLNNAVQDASYMNQCLGYQLFTKAGIPAPRCSFAKVSVNGEALGVYVHVESVKKPFLATHFGDNTGNMYEGTLSDFRTGWTATYERKTNESVPPGTEDRSDIQAVVDAAAIVDDDAMAAALDKVVDLDSFFGFWAVETMISHWDGYGGNNNNHYVYADPATGKFTFMPWGADQLFGGGADPMEPALTRSIITRRLFLHPPSRLRYLGRYQNLLDTIWDETAMLAEVDRVEAMIRPEILAAELADFNMALTGLRTAITGRGQRIQTALNNAGPGNAQGLMQPLCFDQSGTLAATFDVPYGGAANAVTLTIVIGGVTQQLTNVNVFIGASDDKPDTSVMYFVADLPAGRRLVSFVSMPDARVAPGTVDLTDPGLEAILLLFPPGSQEADKVYFMSGDLSFTAAAPTANASWKGTLAARLWDPPWF